MRFSLFVVLVALLLRTGIARADQQADAGSSFREALAAHARAEFETAARLFEEAHRLAPHPSAVFNAGIAWDRAGIIERAATDYETALELGGLTEQQAEEAVARLASLRRVLGYLKIAGPAGFVISVAYLERASTPVRLYVKPGTVTIRVVGGSPAALGNKPATRTLEVLAGQVLEVKFELPPTPMRALAAPPTKQRSPDPEEPDPKASSAQEIWGWVSIGAAVLGAGVATVLGINALAAKQKFDDSAYTNKTARADAENQRFAANVSWAAAGGLGALGAALVLTSPTFRF